MLARSVEGVLAELTGEGLGPAARLEGAARAWKRLNANPRGLPDFGVWRDDPEQRLALNRDFEIHRNAVEALLVEGG